MAAIVDDDIQRLKKKMAALQLRLERAQAVNACVNLMDKYQYYHMRGMRIEETHLFALKTPGACVEMFEGIYDEPEGVLRWKKAEGYGKPRQKGIFPFPLHCMTTPIIEVAEDGKTAKGLWLMVGVEAGDGLDGKMSARWAAGRFAMDFIKEDGEWKIWKYHATSLILTPHVEVEPPLDMTRAQLEENVERDFASKGEFGPDRYPSFPFVANEAEWQANIPPIPLPYESWNDSLACVPPPGKKWNVKKVQGSPS